MCRLWSVLFLAGVAVTVAVVEALSRVVEEDQDRRRLNRPQPVSFEEKLAEHKAWEGKPMTRAEYLAVMSNNGS